MRYALNALQRNTENRKEVGRMRDMFEAEKLEFEKYVYVKEEDLRRSRAIEDNLLKQIRDLEE